MRVHVTPLAMFAAWIDAASTFTRAANPDAAARASVSAAVTG